MTPFSNASVQQTSAAASRDRHMQFSLRRPAIFASVLIVGLFAAVGGWAASARLTGAVIAQGTFAVERNVKKVQHVYGGVVAEILARNGDVVEAGQVLVRLDPTQLQAEYGVIQSQYVESVARAARLQAEGSGASAVKFPAGFVARSAEAKDAADSEVRLFASNAKYRESQKQQFRLKIEQTRDETEGLKSQLEAKNAEIAVVEKELSGLRPLLSRQIVTQTRVNAMERDLSRLTGERGSLSSQVLRAKGQISEFDVQILAIDETARAQAQRELRTVETRIAELMDRTLAAKDKLSRIDIRAPQSGLVHDTIVHTVGGVVGAAEQLMIVVPQDENLSIQARVQPNELDQVKMGSPARLRLTAFNQQLTPEVDGRVVHVPASITVDPKTGQSYYEIKLEMDDKARKTVDKLKLVPGMPVEVYISTGERTALSYLAKPFTDQMRRAFRE